MEKVKTCTRCGLEKPVSEFTNSGRGSWCKACHALECREWRERNKTRSPRRANLDAMPWEEIFRRFEAGETANALSLEYGMSVSALRGKLVERFGSSKRKSLTPRQQKVLDLYNQGLCNSEISEALGWTGNNRNNVSNVLRALGISRTEEEVREARCRGFRYSAEKAKSESETKIRELIESSGLEYLGGYTNCDGFIDVHYPLCGHDGRLSCTTLRHQKRILPCAVCAREQRQRVAEEKERQKAEAKEAAKEAARIEQEAKKAAKQASKQAEKAARVNVCLTCGAEFHPEHGGRHYCSDDCRRKAGNRRRSARKRGQRRTIQLEQVFQKEKGRCYLCGESCDFEDYQIIDGAFVVGPNYPTVEHVIPMCQGGDDSWENVRLACHRCNSIKGRKSNVRVEKSGQIAFVL